MLENLFSSKILFLVLKALFANEDKVLATAEIIKLTNKKQANVSRELDKLDKWEMILKTKEGAQNYYQVNKAYVYYKTLKNFFIEAKKKEKKYLLYNEEDGTAFLSLHYLLRGFASDFSVKDGITEFVPEMITHYKNNYVKFYFEESEINKLTEDALKKLLDDSSFVDKIIKPKTLESGKRALKILNDLKKKDFKFPKGEAVKVINEFCDIVSRQCSYNIVGVLDLRTNAYSNYLKDYLTKKVKNTDTKLHYAIEKLMAPEELTLTQMMRIELIEIVVAYKTKKLSDYKDKIKALTKKWEWLNFGYRGPGLEYSYLEQSFNELASKSLSELEKTLKDIKNYEKNTKDEKDRLFSLLKIDKKHEKFIRTLSLLSYLKIYRKDIAFLVIYCTYKILDHYNKDIKKKNLFYLRLQEAEELILGKLKIDRETLEEREKECLYLANSDKVLVAEEARKFLKENNFEEEEKVSGEGLSLLEGTTACLGETGNWVYGEVKVVNLPEDMSKMKEGDILVSVATTPPILVAMKKATAIVTDHGGITCHAAIVSRELNIPCLIGTKYATKVFKDGDKVVVCPRHGYIKFQ